MSTLQWSAAKSLNEVSEGGHGRQQGDGRCCAVVASDAGQAQRTALTLVSVVRITCAQMEMLTTGFWNPTPEVRRQV